MNAIIKKTVKKVLSESSFAPNTADETVKLAKEILNHTQYLQFDADRALVQAINQRVNRIIVLNQK